MTKLTKRQCDDKVSLLKNNAGRLIAAIQDQLENDSPKDFVDGTTHRNPRLETVAHMIDEVLGSFDALQEKLGLERGHESRYRKFLEGRCN